MEHIGRGLATIGIWGGGTAICYFAKEDGTIAAVTFLAFIATLVVYRVKIFL